MSWSGASPSFPGSTIMSTNNSNHSNDTNANNINIDELLDDLNQLSSPIIFPSSSNRNNTGSSTSSNQFSSNRLSPGPNISVNTKDGIASYNSGGSFFSNYSNNSNNNSLPPTTGNPSNSNSNTNNTLHYPHPPKNRSPIQANPKNKFAVLPENSSRGVSPLTVEGNHNNQNQNSNMNTTLTYSSSNTHNSNNSSSSFNSFKSAPPYSTSSSTSTFPSTGLAYSTPQPTTMTRNPSSLAFASTTSSSSNTGLPGIEKPVGGGMNSKPRSRRNSFDDDAINNIFEELELNDRPNHHQSSIPAVTAIVSNSMKSLSRDSWDEDSHHSASSSSNLQIPKLKGSQPISPPFIPSTSTPQSQSKVFSSNPSVPLTPLSASSGKQRCSKVILAGSQMPRGLKSSAFSKVACDALLCSQCNFKVLSFPDAIWDEDHIDYMFFRNNMPNIDKLQVRLLRKEGSVAYCCQCQWSAEKEERVLSMVGNGSSNDPKWICSGHAV